MVLFSVLSHEAWQFLPLLYWKPGAAVAEFWLLCWRDHVEERPVCPSLPTAECRHRSHCHAHHQSR